MGTFLSADTLLGRHCHWRGFRLLLYSVSRTEVRAWDIAKPADTFRWSREDFARMMRAGDIEVE